MLRNWVRMQNRAYKVETKHPKGQKESRLYEKKENTQNTNGGPSLGQPSMDGKSFMG